MPPRPTPTSQLELRGSWRAATRPNEPQPEAVTDLTAPPELKGAALAVWGELAPRLVATGVLRDVDLYAFVRFCHLTALWRTILAEVEKSPKRDSILALAKVEEMLRKLDAGFGLTPSDRVGIAVEQPSSND